jgi:hypothetical protein
MNDAVAEFDRTLARRRVVPYRDVPVVTVEAFYQDVDRVFAPPAEDASDEEYERDADPEQWPPEKHALVDTLAELHSGQAVLVDQAGVRWVASNALKSMDEHVHMEEESGNNTFLDHLFHCLLEHRALRQEQCRQQGPGVATVFLDAATLDPTCVFCTSCRKWIDLAAEDAEADRLEATGEIAPWEG